MNIVETGIKDLLIIEPRVFGDERGFFMESYNKSQLEPFGLNYDFVQDNHSKSKYGVIRGLHYQNAPHAQTKLIRVLTGRILDVVVDLRKVSSTFGKVYSIELSADNKKQLLIPKGFAHGFSTLSDYAEILYKCDEYYHPESEGGIIYNDPDLAIDWNLKNEDAIVSEKDIKHPSFKNAQFNF